MLGTILAVLVSQLGADEFRVRERAEQALTQLGPAAHFHLSLAERSTDQEARARARHILDRWYAEHAEELAARHGDLPWIDVLPDRIDQGYAYPYLERARKQVGICGPPGWDDYRLATRFLIADLYAQRRGHEVNGLLAGLRDAERIWAAKYQR